MCGGGYHDNLERRYACRIARPGRVFSRRQHSVCLGENGGGGCQHRRDHEEEPHAAASGSALAAALVPALCAGALHRASEAQIQCPHCARSELKFEKECAFCFWLSLWWQRAVGLNCRAIYYSKVRFNLTNVETCGSQPWVKFIITRDRFRFENQASSF